MLQNEEFDKNIKEFYGLFEADEIECLELKQIEERFNVFIFLLQNNKYSLKDCLKDNCLNKIIHSIAELLSLKSSQKAQILISKTKLLVNY